VPSLHIDSKHSTIKQYHKLGTAIPTSPAAMERAAHAV
jgi:hypothetical protein